MIRSSISSVVLVFRIGHYYSHLSIPCSQRTVHDTRQFVSHLFACWSLMRYTTGGNISGLLQRDLHHQVHLADTFLNIYLHSILQSRPRVSLLDRNRHQIPFVWKHYHVLSCTDRPTTSQATPNINANHTEHSGYIRQDNVVHHENRRLQAKCTSHPASPFGCLDACNARCFPLDQSTPRENRDLGAD